MRKIEAKPAAVSLIDCQACAGSGLFRGVFHVGSCSICDGAGLVCAGTGVAVDRGVLVVELRRRLNLAMRTVRIYEQVRAAAPAGPAADYTGSKNDNHRGGGNWTGD